MSKAPFLTRAAFARLSTPLARGALRIGLTPDGVTILGTIASVAGALTLFPMGKLFAGACVVWISEELDDLLAYAHRIAVIYGGAIAGIVRRQEATRQIIGRLMAGMDFGVAA